MRTSGLFTTHEYQIDVKSINDEIFIVPFSDVHFGSAGFCESTWDDFAEWCKEQKNIYYIGNGDYVDCFRSTVQRITRETMDDNELKYIDRPIEKMLGQFENKIDFMRGRLIGLGDGNHGWTFRDGRNETQVLAHDMGCAYLGVLAAIRITFHYLGCYASITYVQHHGKPSGARTAGGKFNNTEWMSRQYDAEIVAMGDDHRKGITQGTTRVRFYLSKKTGSLTPVEYTPLLVRTGSCQKLLIPGTANYGVDRNLGPLPLGFNAIRVRLVRRKIKGEKANKSLRVKLGAHDII